VYLLDVQGVVERPRRDLATWFVVAGVITTLSGLVADLIAHAANPQAHAHEELITFGSGNNPWHLVLFAGILITAVGGILWVSRLRSEAGAVIGAIMVVLLVAVVAIGGWTGWRNANAGSSHPLASGTHAHHGGSAHANHAIVTGEGAEGASHHAGKAGPVTAAQRKVLVRQLATAKHATAKYRDIDVAKADGYFQVTQFIPGLGLHLVNLRIPNTTFDPARPQLLLYQPTAAGGMKLVGVAYQFAHTTDTPPAGFAGGSDVWHFHDNLCFLRGGSETIADSEATCRAQKGIFQAQTAWLLHAWVWQRNPLGVFTETNPTVG
jgi:hypothetical protein